MDNEKANYIEVFELKMILGKKGRKMYCPNCGKEIPDNANFCKECGYQIKHSKDKTEEIFDKNNDKKNKKSKKKVLIPVVILGIAVFGVGGYFFISNSLEEKEIQISANDNLADHNSEKTENSQKKVEVEDKENVEKADEQAETENTELKEQDTEDSSEENILTDPITMGWGGAYIDEETGERIIIAAIGYEWSYCFYMESGEVFQSESNCSSSVDGYLSGQYYTFCKNENGLLGVTSGAGGVWGNFRRISGTNHTDTEIEGEYGNEDTVIKVSEQMALLDEDYVPTGSDIATVEITYNNGLVINARLYTQGDYSLAIVDRDTQKLHGIVTFKDKKAIVQGSNFDGEYTLVENRQ